MTTISNDLTVVLFTSPIPSHPSDWMLENVCTSIKYQLSECRILILADGGLGSKTVEYEEFKHIVKNCGLEMIEFTGWHHQTLMLKYCLESDAIKTSLVLVGEHDWGFRALPIDWKGITEALLDPAMPFSLVQNKASRLRGMGKRTFRQVHRHAWSNIT